MKPYDIINHIVEDLIGNHFSNDYCYMYFLDNIRFDHSITNPMLFLLDKSICSGTVNPLNHEDPNKPLEREYFFHANKWLRGTSGKGKNYLRNTTSNNFYQHSFEPIYIDYDKVLWDYVQELDTKRNSIVLHSEQNSKDIDLLQTKNIKNVHWFSHAYICSEIYFKKYKKFKMVREYKLRPINFKWINANRLLRQHRVDLLEKINLSQGCYSLMNPDPNGFAYNGSVPAKSFDCHENHSAEISIDTLNPWNTSFLHIVSETVWQDKIHLTEKIFKPIVLHQPFVLLQAPGSLEYFKSYGFRTFNNWWDEGYDNIKDPTERLNAIAKIINDIGNMTLVELEALRKEMADVLEYNFCHFYENIPAICLEELEKNIKLL